MVGSGDPRLFSSTIVDLSRVPGRKGLGREPLCPDGPRPGRDGDRTTTGVEDECPEVKESLLVR